jgi:hypothetical protein
VNPDAHARPGSAEDAAAPSGLATTCLAGVRARPVKWLVDGVIPLGKLVMFAGDGGHGKTTLTLELAACLTTNRCWLGRSYAPPPAADVLLISCEDDLADTVVPRLQAVGADLARVYAVDGVHDARGRVQPFSLAHAQKLAEELVRRPGVRLVVIDPAGAYIGRTGVDDHKDSDLRSLLGPLAELAARHEVTIILVKHLNKGATARAVHKVSGSAGYVNAVRAAFVVCPDRGDAARKLFLPIKSNLGPDAAGYAFRLEPVGEEDRKRVLEAQDHLGPEDRDRLARQLFRPAWEGEAGVTADEALGEAAGRRPRQSKVELATEWLRQFLARYAYPSDEIQAAAVKAGFTFDNIKEAKALLKAEGLHNSNMGRFQGRWWSGFGDPAGWELRSAPEGGEGNHQAASPPPHTPRIPPSDDHYWKNGRCFDKTRESGECGEVRV